MIAPLGSLTTAPGTVLCHGTFDLLHPGHVAHLEAARQLGQRLVVTVTADQFVKKGPNRPVFPAQQRAKMLSALSCVDHVAIVEHRTGLPAIAAVRPCVYVKGKDWEAKQDDPDFIAEETSVREHGGRVVFLGDTLYSSTSLINRTLRPQNASLREFVDQVKVSPAQFRAAVNALAHVKVCVLGDPIRDVYHTVDVQGLTAKASALSLRHVSTESQDGGVWAIVNHLGSFSQHVRYIPLVDEPVVKERFVSHPTGDQPLTKYFALMKTPLPAKRTEMREVVAAALAWADLCVVADFGHGAMTDQVRKQVQDDASFLAVNCQTNSANYGFNILSRRYWSCDLLSLDRTELDLCAGDRGRDPAKTLCELRRQQHAQYAFLTRGDVDTIAMSTKETVTCPALEAQPVDALGAGDAFFALVSLAGAKRYSLALATLMGQLAGAQAVRTVGNRSPVSKSLLIEHGCQLLAK